MKINVNKKSGVLLGLAVGLMLAAMALFTGCPNKITVKPETFAVTFSAEEHGTLKAKADGVTETNKSPISVEKDKTVVFTAVPEKGYEVEKWTVNGTAVANNVSTTYSHKVTAAVTVKVSFKALPPSAVAVTGVTLDKPTVSLVAGTSTTLTATVLPANATNKTVAWSSDQPAIASVDKNGTVTAHKAGEAVIIVTTEDGGKTASCKVNVTAKPPTTYKITFSVEGGNGTLKAKAEGIAETTISPINVEHDKTVTFTATADSGYRVKGWTRDGEAVNGKAGTYSLKVSKAASVKVNFEVIPKHAVTFNVEGGNGNLTAQVDGGAINSGAQVYEGNTVTFTAAPAAGYRVKSWALDGTAVNGKAGTYSLKVSKAASVKVSFELIPPAYTVTFNVDGGNGTLKAKADGITETEASPITVKQGETVIFTAVPDAGYRVKNWTLDGTAVNGKAGTYSLKVSKAASVKVNFEVIPKYGVTFSVDGGNGNLTATVDGTAINSAAQVYEGKTVTFTAEPAAGYRVKSWALDGSAVNGKADTYELTVSKAVAVKVNFELIPPAYTVTFNVDGGNGNLTAQVDGGAINSGAQVYEGNTVIFTAVPAAGYRVKSWTLDGTAVNGKAGTYSLKVSKAVAVKVNFEVIPPAYTVTFNVDGGNGTLKAKADGITETEASPITVKQGETVTVTATPDSGYVVEKWTVTPADALQSGGTDGSTTATVKITAATTVTVTFKPAVTPPPASADKTYTVDGVSFTMKGIAAVTGGSVGHTSESDNKPHTVSLTAYRIGETEVTQELWQAVMGHNPSYFTSDAADGEIQGKRPVETVTWFDCIAFCNELTKKVAELGEAECVYYLKENDTTVYTKEHAQARKEPVQKLEKKGFRLPTEAEWEWAAKGGTENKWAGTDTGSELKNYAWYSSNSDRKTHEVKKKTRNGYGLHDMSGNVWEWCWDWYGSLPDPVPADYTGADSGSYRVHRGGSWYNDAVEAARAFRINFNPSVRDLTLGLRVVSCP